MNKKQFLGVTLAALLGGVIAIGGFKYFSNDGKKSVSNQFISIDEEQKYNLTGLNDAVPTVDFREAAKKSTPGVVHIRTYKKVTQSSSPNDQFFKDFFGDQYRSPQPQSDEPQPAASGSGVILTPSGYIGTNNHVVEGADKVFVVLHDKRKYEAKVIGTDPTTDLALLKIDENDLPFIPYGNSDKVEVGEWVLAVGNPFNLNSTVTAGIVSAKARNINILRDKENLAIESFIQTDAAVNPGNSGGALVNTKGELIGINTAIATPTGTFAGYSFAVPSSLVKKVMQDLKEFGQVQRALMGVVIQDVTADLVEEKGLNKIEGVYINDVRENSAADVGGIKQGDIITEVAGKKVNSSSELQEAVALYRPGDKIKVKYKRGTNIKESEIVLKNKLGTTEVVKKGDKMIVEALGARMRELNSDEKSKYKVKSGVLIESIQNGKLRANGLKSGDVILKINRVPVNSANDVEILLQRNRDGSLIEVIDKNGKRSFIGFGW